MVKAKLIDKVIEKYKKAKIEYPLLDGKKEITIGRRSVNDITIPQVGYRSQEVDEVARTVSKKHCTIYHDVLGFGVFDKVGDKESKYGTFINGMPVISGNEVSLKNGDELRLGKYELEFVIEEDESA